MASDLLNLVSDKNRFDEESFFKDYAVKAQRYLDRDVFAGTPMTGQMLATAARQAYRATGRIVPLDIALSQAQFESGMGRKGRSPSTNPYNVGEFDDGTKQTFKDTQSGVNAYFSLMAKDYLSKRTPEQLLQNFVNYRGDRYASNKEYENKLREQADYINRFLGTTSVPVKSAVRDMSKFDKAFAEARAAGKKTFMFENKKYTTEVK